MTLDSMDIAWYLLIIERNYGRVPVYFEWIDGLKSEV